MENLKLFSIFLNIKNKIFDRFYKIRRVFLLAESIKLNELISQIIRIILFGNRNFTEKKVTFGNKNPNEIFYIIRRTPPGAGLFSNYLLILMHLYYAELNSYKAIIDWENYSNFYQEKNIINNTKNSWGYYFKQPITNSLEEVYKSKNVIFSSSNVSNILETDYSVKDLNKADFIQDADQIKKFNNLSKSINLNEPTNLEVQKRLDNTFQNKKNILGIVLRGTDYLNKELSRGHATPFNIDNSIEIVESLLNEWNMEHVYLSTEVSEYVEIYQDYFNDKLVVLSRDRYLNHQNKKFINQYTRNRKHDKYLTGLEYLVEVYGLARCDSIVGTSCGSLNAAIILNNNRYQNKKIFDLGRNY